MSQTIKVYDVKGSVVGDFVLEDQYIELEKGAQAVHDTVIAYQAGLRAGTACTKTKAEVRGGGIKPFKQKGTGRARSGSIRNPIWTGGGTIHGPKPRSFAKKINKKVRSLAIKRAFSERVSEDAVIILNELALSDCKTKNAKTILDNLGINRKEVVTVEGSKRKTSKTIGLDRTALIIVKEYTENSLRAFSNIPNALLIKADSVNVYQMLNFKKVIVAQDAMETLVQRFV